MVDPGWRFERLEIYPRGKDTIVAVYRMTINDTFRDGVGMATVQYGKDKQGQPTEREVNEAEKSAATDALKRCARLFGVGRYILDLPSNVTDVASLTRFLNGAQNAQTGANSSAAQSNGSTHAGAQNGAKTVAWDKEAIKLLSAEFGLDAFQLKAALKIDGAWSEWTKGYEQARQTVAEYKANLAPEEVPF
jgi:hypothetical protein